MVKQCISKLSDAGVQVVLLTCDGPSCHFSMIKSLDGSLDANNLQPYFRHPIDDTQVYVFLDACHMLKLVRNTFGQTGILIDERGRKIKWSYIVELQKLQEDEGFNLANKLRKAHIDFKTQKMKVNLAAQTRLCQCRLGHQILQRDIEITPVQRLRSNRRLSLAFQ